MVKVKAAALIFILLLLPFSACKQGDNLTADGITIEYFKATPDNIDYGGKSVLAWSVSGTITVSIDNGIGQVTASGEVDVSPKTNTTYKLTAGDASASITVTVRAPLPHAQIVYFSADDYSVPVYQSVKVSWSVINATSAKISGMGYVDFTGSLDKKFDNTETLTLEALGSDGQWVSQAITISVDRRTACNWITSSNHGWTFTDLKTCIVETATNGSPYYSAKNVLYRVTIKDKTSGAVVDTATGNIPSVAPGAKGYVTIKFATGKRTWDDTSTVELVSMECPLIL
jgi:hypothetical protein